MTRYDSPSPNQRGGRGNRGENSPEKIRPIMSGAAARVAAAGGWADAGFDGISSSQASISQPNERLIMMGCSYAGRRPRGKDHAEDGRTAPRRGEALVRS